MPLTAEIPNRRSRLFDVASTVRFVAKRLGWAHALLFLCAAALRRISVHIFVVATHPFEDHLLADADPQGLEGRLLGYDEVLRYFDREEGYGYSSAFAAQALARGDRCVGLFERGRLVWYCWYAREAAPVVENVEAVADRPFLYAYNVYTEPSRRGCGLHDIGVNVSVRIFAREGYRAFSAYVEALNLPMLIAARKKGDHFVGLMLLHRTLGRIPLFATRGCRDAGLRLRRSADATVAGQPVSTTTPRVI